MDWIELKLLILNCLHKTRYFLLRIETIILRQELCAGKTNFVLLKNRQLITISAQDLYKKTELLLELSRKDLITIVSTAVNEQAIDDCVFALKLPSNVPASSVVAIDSQDDSDSGI